MEGVQTQLKSSQAASSSFRRNLSESLKNNDEKQCVKIRKFNCKSCAFRTTTKKSLIRHNMAIHEGISYQCKFCELKVSTKDSLKRHVHIYIYISSNSDKMSAAHVDNYSAHGL